MAGMTTYSDNCEKAAKNIIDHVGKNIVFGAPLGLGKPVGIMNALYQMAESDKSIKLTFITALTLARPILHNELEKRFVEPFLDRILKDYEELLYEKARVEQKLPSNVTIIEFFLSTAKFLHNNYVQQNYISTSYTDVARDTVYYKMNAIGQQVSHRDDNKDLYSLSCNSDLFHDVVQRMEATTKKFAVVAEVNNNLPFMHGDAVIESKVFTDIVDTRHYKTLFAVPHDELSIEDQLIGLYTSTLIKDDSCLQIGIGKLSNALTAALIMRQNDNELYQELLTRLQVKEKFRTTIEDYGDTTIFKKGLYASTEMLCDGYLQLYKENILKKKVYDHAGLQRLLNAGLVTENISSDILDVLLEHKVIHPVLTQEDFEFLQKFGIFESDIDWNNGSLVLPTGESLSADLTVTRHKNALVSDCLGQKLKLGHIAHAAFFLGSSDLYRELLDLSYAELETMNMTAVARTNSLLWNPELLTLQRQHARFVNSAMMVTLGCVMISDGLANMSEVSGVGGQFDFVEMAVDLEGSRSIINCRSTRTAKGKTGSNIIWEYPNTTIPRFLRDIVITEYGIADCRSKTDSEVIKAMLNVSDSRFQDVLLKSAKKAGKIPADYQIPKLFRNNFPAAIEPVIRDYQHKGHFDPYPFGTELTETEKVLKPVLLKLGDYSKGKLLLTVIASWFYVGSDSYFKTYLERMQLYQVSSFNEWVYKKLLKFMLRDSIKDSFSVGASLNQ
jgi:acyl-CoA hydrolase